MADAWDKPQFNVNALVGAVIGIAVVQILFVAARFYTRFMQRMEIAFDDYLILLALVCNLTHSEMGPTVCEMNKMLTSISDSKFSKVSNIHFPYVLPLRYIQNKNKSSPLQWPRSGQSNITSTTPTSCPGD
jgi:hypothetical protein